MDDLFKALSMFQQGVQQYQMQSAIGQAHDYVTQVRQSDLDDRAKRAELHAVSNELVARMAGMGAPATTLQAVGGAFAPWEDPLDVEARRQKREDQLLEKKHEFEMAKLNKQLDAQLEAAGMKAGKPAPMTTGEIERITEAETTIDIGSDLINTVKDNQNLLSLLNGTAAGTVRKRYSADFAKFDGRLRRFFNAYKFATTGAAASDKEMEDLKKAIATSSDSPESFLANLRGYMDEAQSKRTGYIANLKAANKRVDKFSPTYTPKGLGKQSAEAPQFKVQTLRDKATGQLRKAKVYSDGTFDWE
jgi:hypothetical protein